jgi:hypothetical protein
VATHPGDVGLDTVAGLMLIAAYWVDIIAKGSLIGVQTGLLACPLMFVVMLFRFPLYSTSHDLPAVAFYRRSAPSILLLDVVDRCTWWAPGRCEPVPSDCRDCRILGS